MSNSNNLSFGIDSILGLKSKCDIQRKQNVVSLASHSDEEEEEMDKFEIMGMVKDEPILMGKTDSTESGNLKDLTVSDSGEFVIILTAQEFCDLVVPPRIEKMCCEEKQKFVSFHLDTFYTFHLASLNN